MSSGICTEQAPAVALQVSDLSMRFGGLLAVDGVVEKNATWRVRAVHGGPHPTCRIFLHKAFDSRGVLDLEYARLKLRPVAPRAPDSLRPSRR